MKVNILILKYVIQEIELPKDEFEQVLREVVSNEEVEEQYVRDFLNCSSIHKNSDLLPMDTLMFIDTYGSKKAKKIAVDEKLKRK